MVSIYTDTEQETAPENQRLQRSEYLLSQLYHDDVNPRFVMPDLRAVKALLYFSVMAAILFTGTLFYKFNNFILLREDVRANASNLDGAIARRKNLFSNLINLTLNHAALEHSVFTITAKTRADTLKNSSLPPDAIEKLIKSLDQAGLGTEGKGKGALPTDWKKALEAFQKGGGMKASLGRLMAVVEQYPNIRSAQTYTEAMKALINMEDKIAMRRIKYNEVAQMYNSGISKWPWKLLANWTDFKRFTYFNAHEEEMAPLLTEDIFKQMMPAADLLGKH